MLTMVRVVGFTSQNTRCSDRLSWPCGRRWGLLSSQCIRCLGRLSWLCSRYLGRLSWRCSQSWDRLFTLGWDSFLSSYSLTEEGRREKIPFLKDIFAERMVFVWRKLEGIGYSSGVSVLVQEKGLYLLVGGRRRGFYIHEKIQGGLKEIGDRNGYDRQRLRSRACPYMNAV